MVRQLNKLRAERPASGRESTFRPDVNGLRAIAVALVILFHFGVPHLGGGFVGVDVFFVISGFLMTRIILVGLREGRFSFVGFYGARARRIIPALAAMLVALTAIGYVWLDPLAYSELARYSVSAILFVSNVVFAGEAGYFTPVSEQVWLLHTWSLSVEWQFYLVFPVYLALAGRIHLLTGYRPLLVLVVPLLLSLAAGIAATSVGGRPLTYSFFLLPSRAWEMIAGGLVYLATAGGRAIEPRSALALEAAGLAAIVSGALIFSDRTPWPSYEALLPVVGTVAVILANRGTSSLLTPGPVQAIGLASYSIYLWHWPVLVLSRYALDRLDPATTSACIVLSIVLGLLSYKLVEVPARSVFERGRNSATPLIGWVGCSLAIAAASFAIWMQDGLPSRAKGDAGTIRDAMAASREWGFPPSCGGSANGQPLTCRIGTPTSGMAAVFGDSHAQMLYPRFQAGDEHIVFVTNAGCPAVPNVERAARPDCLAWRKGALDLLNEHQIGTVIYVAFWSELLTEYGRRSGVCLREGDRCVAIDSDARRETLFQGLLDEIRSFVAGGKRVVVVLPIPTFATDVPKAIVRAEFKGGLVDLRSARSADEEAVRSYLLRAQEVGAVLIDPRRLMCDAADRCPAVDARGHSLYKDNNHLRPDVVKNLSIIDPFVSAYVPKSH